MTSALVPVENLRAARRARLGRQMGVTLLSLVLLAGVTGLFGVRTATARASAGGFGLEVDYPRISRGGLAATWSVRLTGPGGFDAPVVLTTTAAYFDLFDHNVLSPEPSSARSRGEMLEWTFDPPAGDVLTVSLDARIEPARQSGGDATTSILVQGRSVVRVEYRTVILP